jgi:hypothetical protein
MKILSTHHLIERATQRLNSAFNFIDNKMSLRYRIITANSILGPWVAVVPDTRIRFPFFTARLNPARSSHTVPLSAFILPSLPL